MDEIADRKVHIRCSLSSISSCSNSLCKKSIVGCMHETAKRLLDLGLANGAKNFTEIAKALGGSDQSATNWKSRGVPKSILIEAARRYRVDIAWISADAHAAEPAIVTRWRSGKGWAAPANPESPPKAEQNLKVYDLHEDEQIILDGFRLADEGLKRAMLLLAKDSLERAWKRILDHH